SISSKILTELGMTGFTELLAVLNLRLASKPTMMMSHGSARGFEKIVPLLRSPGERNVPESTMIFSGSALALPKSASPTQFVLTTKYISRSGDKVIDDNFQTDRRFSIALNLRRVRRDQSDAERYWSPSDGNGGRLDSLHIRWPEAPHRVAPRETVQDYRSSRRRGAAGKGGR